MPQPKRGVSFHDEKHNAHKPRRASKQDGEEFHETSGDWAEAATPDSNWGFDSEPPFWAKEARTLANCGTLMNPDKFFVSQNTGLKIHIRSYMKNTHNRHVFLFHGLNDHCNKYSYQCLARELEKSGCTVHGMDMQAHGHSQEFEVQYIGHWTELVDDAVQWVQLVMKGKPDSHIFQFVSHGTGGAIALKLQEMLQDSTDEFGKLGERFRGHYAMAPLVTPAKINPITLCCLESLLCCFKDTFEMSTWLYPARKLDKCPWEVYQTRKLYFTEARMDPLHWDSKTPCQTGKTLLDFAAHVRSMMHLISSPIKVAHGKEDGVAPISGSEDLVNCVAFGRGKKTDEMIWKLPDEKHVILSGNYGEELVEDICAWLTKYAKNKEHLANPVV
ncbi:hypothetical protein TrRE_jg8766 [Triparma retinervis]|uniref:Serine aminopeptidase S33 domain-containing protein n=1 Tax=Triparma retinervis TaxID=2557542 RepID=A0A9W6Z664_9STRA|nr:hypothetical protein TrRE_jg8766 [Triparma retinervis]